MIRRAVLTGGAIGALCAATLIAVGGSSVAGWSEAIPGRTLVLPGDHRSHPEFRLEWWYYTGHLRADGRSFGYQITFFRIGVHPSPPTPSRWAVRDLFMTHVALTDLAGSRHVAFERLSRAGAGWAGASASTYEVWNEDWRGRLDAGVHRLTAATDAFSLDLTLHEGKRPVLHGLAGYSRKGSSAGNASYYYSLTRMPTAGRLTYEGVEYHVEGESWMDHEFGTTFLERTQAGWDWFSIQLDDGTELMVFRLRDRNESADPSLAGAVDPRSSGTLVARDGRSQSLEAAEFQLSPGRIWVSPRTAGRYPVEWTVRVPGEGLDLSVHAAVDAQELNGLASGVAYWEGAIRVRGTRRGRPIAGRGYLEMTGYGGRPIGDAMGAGR